MKYTIERMLQGMCIVLLAATATVFAREAVKPVKLPDLKVSAEQKPAADNSIKEAGLTTEQLDSGNWVLKRKYWEEAGGVFGQLRTLNAEMRKKQDAYIKAQAEADKKVDTAFSKLGFEQGELNSLLGTIVKSMEAERQKQGDLSAEEREFLSKLKEKQKSLEQLRKDLDAVGTIDATIKKTVKTALGQLDEAASIENKAWSDYEKIGKVLSHTEAHDLFYKIHGALENVTKIDQYLTHSLWQSMQANIQKVDQHLSKISSGVEELKKQGVDFGKELIEFRKTDEEREAERRAYEEEQERMAKAQATRKKKKTQTWWDTVKSYLPW